MTANSPFPDIYIEPENPEKLYQGDILVGISIDMSMLEDASSIIAFMIVSNTCDLHLNKVDHILFVPIRPLDFLVKEHEAKSVNKNKIMSDVQKIVTNQALNSFFLPHTNKFGGTKHHYADLSIMLFHPYTQEVCDELIQSRKTSITSPCREKLGHILGNFFSRIGIPPRFEVNRELIKDWKKNYVEDLLSS